MTQVITLSCKLSLCILKYFILWIVQTDLLSPDSGLKIHYASTRWPGPGQSNKLFEKNNKIILPAYNKNSRRQNLIGLIVLLVFQWDSTGDYANLTELNRSTRLLIGFRYTVYTQLDWMKVWLFQVQAVRTNVQY